MLLLKVLGVGRNGSPKWFKLANITPLPAQLTVARQGYKPIISRQYRLSKVPLKYFVNRENK